MKPEKNAEEEVRREEEIRQKISKFLRSRRHPKTKEYVWKIIERLESERSENAQKNVKKSEIGWVRVRTLLDDLVGKDVGKIENATTFYRLVHDLYDDRIIEKRVLRMPHEQGRQATFYRIPFKYRFEWVITRERLEYEYGLRIIYIQDLARQLIVAQDLLKEMGCENPHDKIVERFTHWEKREPLYTAYQDPNRKPGLTISFIARLLGEEGRFAIFRPWKLS